MPNTAPSPWRMFLPLAFVLLLALLWSAYWFIAFGIAKQRFAEQRAVLSEQGLVLACTEESWGGYPFHFEFTCTSPVLTYAGTSQLRSSNLLMVALAYAPWQIAALVDGPSAVTAPGIVPTTISHQRALGSVTFDKAGLPSFLAEIPATVVPGLGRAEKLMLFTRPAAAGGTEIAFQGNGMTYAPSDQAPLAIDAASLQGTLQPDETFKLGKFEMNQGSLRYWGSGMLALDAQRRIAGQIDTETNDINALLSQAGPLLGLSDSKLASLRTMLGLLGNGAKAAIIAKDGLLYLGPFQVAELKPLY
jgi:hypothetical protein